ncbi:hypothetical protein EDC02_3761 [Micromonospora sp. Llam0]|uniref:hypothetical protein n=1 Tax=Micromonospora sp. Llam0 TaxID=2485143 RepID=UPI000F4705CC|nr:hypothetical protein [Micromonospora sp. Llam0]ROO61804.1 hypothetical protein EDC02_3761 [Micromonospora sp. Llam0]
MIDMSTWEVLKVDVLELRLDPLNVRLDLAADAPESDIINDLFVNEKAFALIDSIVKIGILTHDVPIVLKRGRELFVVEGNRRIAALKAIQNPFLAPSHQARINKLLEGFEFRDSLRHVEVKRAPSQADADQLIAALHTGNQRVRWSPARQAAFFQAQIDAGKSAEDLFRLYPTIDVKKFITRSQILNLFRAASYENPALKDFVRARRFPVSTLARLYDNEKFLDLIGVRVNSSDGTVKLETGPKRFALVAEKIVDGIYKKDLDTRSLNSTSSSAYKRLMDEIRDIMNDDAVEDREAGPEPADDTRSSHSGWGGKPSDRRSGDAHRPATGASLSDPQKQDNRESGKADQSTAEKPSKRQRNYLDTEDITVSADRPPAIHQIFNELSNLRTDKFPNATLDLIRTFLEKSIKAYADSMKVDIRASLNAANAKGGGDAKSSVRFVQLGECLIWLEKHFQENGPTALRQVVVKIRAGKVASDYLVSADHMNAINHNHEIFATTSDVRDCWDAMRGLLKAILT